MATLVGSYRKAMTSGTIAAGLTAASYVFAFKFASVGGRATVRRITVSAGDLVGFTAGFINLQAFVVRPYPTIEAIGGAAGTFTINNGKLNSADAAALATCYMTTTAAISGGVGTDDTDPFANCALSVAATAGVPPLPTPFELFRAMPGEAPLILQGSGEGFRLKATVPATGTWQLGVTVDWDEYV